MKQKSYFSGTIDETHHCLSAITLILLAASLVMVGFGIIFSPLSWPIPVGLLGGIAATVTIMAWPRITESMALRALYRIQCNLDRCVDAHPYITNAGGVLLFLHRYEDVDATLYTIRISNPDDNGFESGTRFYSYIEFPTDDARVIFRLLS